jgi:anti-anti-sigma factor
MVSVELRTRAGGSVLVVMLGRELDTVDAESPASAAAALAEGRRQLIIGLEALEALAYLDCHALSALLRPRETTRQAGGDALLAAPRGLVLRLLTLVGMPGVAASVAAAAAGIAASGTRSARELPVLGVPELCPVPGTG